ncbi:MAG: cache domain-containing protein, partial [Planctomycetota bacterium]
MIPNPFKSLRSRILAVVLTVAILTVSLTTLLAVYESDSAILKNQDQMANQLLALVNENVETQHRAMLFHNETLLRHRKETLKDITALALVTLQSIRELVTAGTLTEAQGKAQAIATLRRMRTKNGVGYVWINDMRKPLPHLVMHPILPQREGIDLTDAKYYSAQGDQKHLLQAFVDVCQEQSEGFVTYRWPKPTPTGTTEDRKKISYVRCFLPWQWVIGSGEYIDDIDADRQQALESILNTLSHSLPRLLPPKLGHIAILDGEGRVQAHSTRPNQSRPKKVDSIFFSELVKAARLKTIHFDYERPFSTGAPGEDIRSRAYVSYFAPLDWYIYTSIRHDQIEAPARRLEARILLLSLPILVVAVGLALFLSKNLARPIRRLREVAQRIESEGPQAGPLPVEGSTEARELGTILNHMVDALQETEANHRRSREDLRITLNSIGDAVISTDRDGLITRMNPIAEELTGWAQEDGLGHPITEVFVCIDGVTRSPSPDVLGDALASGTITSIPVNSLLVTRDGSERQIADNAAPIRNAQGEVVG